MIRKYELEDQPKLIDLIKENSDYSVEYIKWKYFGKRMSHIFIYEKNDHIVSAIFTWEEEMTAVNEKMKVLVRNEVFNFTSEELTYLLKDCIKEYAEKNKIEYILNTESEQGTEISTFDRSAIIYRPIKLLAKKMFILWPLTPFDRIFVRHKRIQAEAVQPKDDTYQLKNIDQFDSEADNLQENPEEIRIKKDHHYLNWRYMNHPTQKYEASGIYEDSKLKGYAIIQINNKKVTIVDYQAVPEEDILLSLLTNIVIQYKKYDYLQAKISSNPDINEQLFKVGFIVKDQPSQLFDELANSATNKTSNWFINLGDIYF
ncbi:hypothetical protein CEY16_07550 [Halalkalibacillus sediminis]|uniref:GNAT family N-acetyltransferase n=1 Tax=Halalkalibacillus sediminis TaxID=2018042 RepID=A0A2I0QTW2_9BACI|nr:hypothetical protein [Halalkalibacillus sediminis]PKR77777.1 hypothetical protein CEY16_07550 [Halalkalibacillus sediminis]